MKKLALTLVACFSVGVVAAVSWAGPPEGQGWQPLFNGDDLAGWKLPKGGQGHWKVVEGVIDYDARGGGTLWTEDDFCDFQLHVEWRLKPVEEVYGNKTDEDGKPYKYYPDSGIYYRGTSKCQTNIWTSPVGSGEIWGYRTDKDMPDEVRKGATPKLKADNPVGQWNTQLVTLKGQHMTVLLNGKEVIDAQLPGLPECGPIGLQHHGGYRDGRWLPASACVQFRNIYIRKLPK